MKHSAANTPVLATIKRIFNHKIYKHALSIYNAEGETAALDYVQQYIRGDIYEFLATF